MEKIIRDIYNHLLTGGEASELAGNLLAVAAKANYREPLLQGTVALLAKRKESLDSALLRVRHSEYTARLSAKDGERDDSFLCFRDTVKSKLRKRDPAVREAANRLLEVIKKQGTALQDEGYKQQSLKLDLLFKDLEGADNSAALRLLGLEAELEDLKQAQAAFSAVYDEKTEAEAVSGGPGVRAAKKALVEVLVLLTGLLNLQDELNPGHGYSDSTGQMAEMVSHTMAIARARQTRTENEAEETEQ